MLLPLPHLETTEKAVSAAGIACSDEGAIVIQFDIAGAVVGVGKRVNTRRSIEANKRFILALILNVQVTGVEVWRVGDIDRVVAI